MTGPVDGGTGHSFIGDKKMKRDGSKLRCPDCGVETEPRCSCGKDYIYVSAQKAAKLCREAHPDWGDGKISAAIGVSQPTAWKSRKRELIQKELTEKSHEEDNNETKFRLGKDNKMYPTRKRSSPLAGKKTNQALEDIRGRVRAGQSLDEIDRRDLSDKSGYSHGTIDTAYSFEEGLQKGHEEGRQAALAELGVDPLTLPQSAQVKIDAAIRHYKKRLDSEFELAVIKEISRRVDELVAPRFLEREKEAEECRQAYRRKGVFKKEEYNSIQRCLHPDLSPTVEEKTEAWRLFHGKRLVLLSEQDDPRTYPPIPTAEEFMAGVRRPKRT